MSHYIVNAMTGESTLVETEKQRTTVVSDATAAMGNVIERRAKIAKQRAADMATLRAAAKIDPVMAALLRVVGV